MTDGGPLTAILDAAPTSYTPRTDILVHGDLYARHLLVDEQDRLAGVIDWGDVHLGDPAVDLMVVLSLLPPSAHEAFRRAYGPVEDVTWRMARLRALWHTLAVLAYSSDVGDVNLTRESQRAMSYLSRSLTGSIH